MGKKKSEKAGLNKKLLDKLTASAPQMERDKPTLHLTGNEAKAVHNMKPGSMVSMAVHGKVTSVGLMRYGLDKGKPEADVEIHGMKMMHGKKGREDKTEDKVEGGKEK